MARRVVVLGMAHAHRHDDTERIVTEERQLQDVPRHEHPGAAIYATLV